MYQNKSAFNNEMWFTEKVACSQTKIVKIFDASLTQFGLG
jgi:hypothetical protein